MTTTGRKLTRDQITRLSITGLLAALILIMIYTRIGLMTLPGTSIQITFIHIPVLIGLLAEGPVVSLVLAFVFGAGTLLKGLIAPATPFDPFFINPLISVLPRLLIPLAAWGVFVLVKALLPKTKPMLSVAWSVSALAGSLTNTVFVLLALYLSYRVQIEGILSNIGLEQYAGAAGKFLFFGVALPNGIPEAIATMILVPAVMAAVLAVKKRR